MANQATLRSLKDRALDYADMAGSAFPDENRLRDYVNSGLSELYDIVINAFEDYVRSKTIITLAFGVEEYTLPDDFYKSKKLYWLSGGSRFNIDRYNLREISGYITSPIQSGTVEMWYTPHFVPLNSDDETVPIWIAPGWEDFVALNAAVRLAIREESDSAMLLQEREIQRQRIIDSAEPRDEGESGSVEDYYGRFQNSYQIFGPEERFFKYRILGNKISFVEFEYLGI